MAAVPETVRASGASQAEEVVAVEAAELTEPVDTTLPDDPHLPEDPRKGKPEWRTPGFARMRTSWSPEDAVMMQRISAAIDDRIFEVFQDAFIVMNDLFEVVRTPEFDAEGTAKTDRHGMIIWKRKANGAWEEDWTRLTAKQKENFLFQITTRLFRWELLAADAWKDALFAKAQWEERFGITYAGPQRGTIDDRTNYAKRESAEERYYAVFMASYSRKADAILRVLTNLGQRLKDTLA